MDNFTGDKVHFEPGSQESTKCGKCDWEIDWYAHDDRFPLKFNHHVKIDCRCDACFDFKKAFPYIEPQSAQREGPYHQYDVLHVRNCEFCILGDDPKKNKHSWVNVTNKAYAQGQSSMRAELEAVKADLAKANERWHKFKEWYQTGLGVTENTPRTFKETFKKIIELETL